jgi:hypothetical protein
VARVQDQDLLAAIVISNRYPAVSWEAMQHVTNQPALFRIVMESQDPIQRAAAERLRDQQLLGRVLLELHHYSSPGGAMDLASEHLTDPGIAAKVWIESKNDSIRKAMLDKLDDPDLLGSVAQSDAEPTFRRTAIRRLDSSRQDVFAKVALRDPKWYVRKAAVLRITDPAVLGEVVARDTDFDVLYLARDRLARTQSGRFGVAENFIQRQVQLPTNWLRLRADMSWEEVDDILHILDPHDDLYDNLYSLLRFDVTHAFASASKDQSDAPVSVFVGSNTNVIIPLLAGGSLFNLYSGLSIQIRGGVCGGGNLRDPNGGVVGYVAFCTKPIFGPGTTMVLTFRKQGLAYWNCEGPRDQDAPAPSPPRVAPPAEDPGGDLESVRKRLQERRRKELGQ